MRNQTLAVFISSMLMAAASQAQPQTTDTSATSPVQSQTQSTGSSTTVDAGTTSYESDQSNSGRDAAAMAQQRWSEADTDRNGTLSQAEMQVSMPTIAANFSQMDVNGDGQLSQDEMHSFKGSSDQARWNQSFKTADADSDGSLTLAEAQSGMPMLASHFSTIDADRDGKVTRQELASHHASMHGSSDSSMDADKSMKRSSKTTSTTTTESQTDADKPDSGTSQQ